MNPTRLFLFVLILSTAACRAQNSPNITDPSTILTYQDLIGLCIPQKADSGATNVAGCCAAPGRRGCTGNGSNGYSLPACLAPDPTLTFDSYGAGVLCQLPAVSVDPALATLGQTGSDMTFYITSDIHFFRRTYNLSDQLTHVKVMNNFYSTGATWPVGAGIPVGTPVDKPLAIIIDGDITTHGLAQDLGAFRLNYERGTVPASIQYPVLFGIGNHETVSDETPENAKRMFDYLEARMANTHMDLASGNYSWDWQGVHFVQMNTWAGDRTSVYAHVSDGLTWLANDLKTYVGNTTKPVMLLEHYLLKNVYPWRVSDSTNDDFFPTDGNAIDSTGTLTGDGYESFWKIIQNYNVIGLFGGHDHCLGVYNTKLSNLPVTGALYPSVQGYAMPLDDFDDGSGGDTGDGADNVAGVGNGCAATTINGASVSQTAVASFLVAHVNAQYLDIGAVSWTGNGSAPYFDPAEGLPTGALACRKRINSQFVAASPTIRITQTAIGYSVTSSADTPAGIPIALKFNSRSGLSGFNFVDACADPLDTGTNNLYFLVNGENSLSANTVYTVAAAHTGTGNITATAVLLTPLSGASPSSIAHTVTSAPSADTVQVYGPSGTTFATQMTYTGTAANWLATSPASGSFNAYGIATLTLNYIVPPAGFGSSAAAINVTSTATGVVQSVSVSVTQPALSLALSTSAIYQGGTMILTAQLSPAAAGTTINFMTGSNLLGSAQTSASGIATFPYAASSIGTFSINAAAASSGLTSPSQTLLVAVPVSIAAAPPTVTIFPGNSGNVSLALAPFGGYTGSASLSCSSPVAYVTCTPASMTANFSAGSTLAVSVTVHVSATVASRSINASSTPMYALLMPTALLGFFIAARRRRLSALCILMIMAVGTSAISGCGSGQHSGSAAAQAPSGSQTITFALVASGIPQTTTVAVNFQ